ncbi:MAG: glycosyltransferase family 4 protein [Acholeplasmataceae bacterium]
MPYQHIEKGLSKTGKALFLQRLYPALNNIGVETTNDYTQKHDISLHLVNIKHHTKSKKIVRLDGVYHNTAINYKQQNANIKKSYDVSDAVIYQSNFGQRIAERYLGVHPGLTEIIYNGAIPKFYDDVPSAPKKHSYNFITASRWRPHKRLQDTIEAFLKANISDSMLYVAGDISDSGCKIKKYQTCKNITFLGRINQLELASYFKLCNASIHLCWTDCCPNSVIEALCAGCHVICGNEGGTHELVKPSGGTVIDIDKTYDLNPVNLYSPPSIDHNLIAEAIINSINNSVCINRNLFSINRIAQDYSNYFMRLLNE